MRISCFEQKQKAMSLSRILISEELNSIAPQFVDFCINFSKLLHSIVVYYDKRCVSLEMNEYHNEIYGLSFATWKIYGKRGLIVSAHPNVCIRIDMNVVVHGMCCCCVCHIYDLYFLYTTQYVYLNPCSSSRHTLGAHLVDLACVVSTYTLQLTLCTTICTFLKTNRIAQFSGDSMHLFCFSSSSSSSVVFFICLHHWVAVQFVVPLLLFFLLFGLCALWLFYIMDSWHKHVYR